MEIILYFFFPTHSIEIRVLDMTIGISCVVVLISCFFKCVTTKNRASSSFTFPLSLLMGVRGNQYGGLVYVW
jgi:hypothetical protein